MRRFSHFIAGLLLTSSLTPTVSVHAQQPVTVIGPVTPGDCVAFNSNTVLKDAGFACVNGSIVFGPGASTVGDIAEWNNATGTSLKDVPPSAVVDQLCPTNNYDLLRVSGSWGCGVYTPPSGGTNLYASPTGNDTNNNCTSSGAPCTLKGACGARTQIATFFSGPVTINVAVNSTYNATDSNVALCTIYGNTGGSSPALTTLQPVGYTGTCPSPPTVVFAVPNNSIGVLIKDGGEVEVLCVKFTLGNGAYGIQNAGQGAVSDYGPVTWDATGTSSIHVSGACGSFINLLGAGETITANFNSSFHWSFTCNTQFFGGGATNIPSALTWTSGDFAVAGTAGGMNINLANWSAAGAGVAGSTGPRGSFVGPGYLTTPGNVPCNSALPGNSSCNFFNMFATSGSDPIPLPNNASSIYSNLPSAGLAAGLIAHITDGLAGSCGDGACTTPGTTVTGGSGALDLLVGSDGSSWRVFRAQAIPALANFSGTLAANKGGTGTTSLPTGAVKANGTAVTGQAACADLSNAGTICATNPGIGLAIASTNLNSNAESTNQFSPGLLTSIVNTKGAFTKWVKASTVDNIEGSAAQFSCTGNPTITFYECGTSTTCAAPTTIGSVTVTAAGTVVDGSVSSSAITAGDYTAWAISAGTCVTSDLFGTAQVHSN